jgi:hypothetical protein
LEKIQRRAVTMVSGLKGESYEEKLLELGLPTLEERRRQADMIQTFKIVRGIDRVDYNTWNLRPKTNRLEVRRHFFSNRVVEG